MGWDGMGWDVMAWDGMGWDGMLGNDDYYLCSIEVLVEHLKSHDYFYFYNRLSCESVGIFQGS